MGTCTKLKICTNAGTCTSTNVYTNAGTCTGPNVCTNTSHCTGTCTRPNVCVCTKQVFLIKYFQSHGEKNVRTNIYCTCTNIITF